MNGRFITARLFFLSCLVVVIIIYFSSIIPTGRVALSWFASKW